MARKSNKVIEKIFIYTLLTSLALFFLFPFLFMFFKSVMTPENSSGRTLFFPADGWHFENYVAIFSDTLIKQLINTLIIMVANGIIVPFAACLCAYGFARGKFKSKELWFTLVLATMMLPSMVTQVPLFVLFNSMNMVGTYWPLIIPNIFGGGALNIFLARQFIRGIPKEMDEAATIDGANRMYIFVRIIFPMLKSIIIFILINTLINCWRDFEGALIYITDYKNDGEYMTLALGMFNMFKNSSAKTNRPAYLMATGVFMTLPMAILFFIFQKQLIDGVAMTGMKE